MAMDEARIETRDDYLINMFEGHVEFLLDKQEMEADDFLQLLFAKDVLRHLKLVRDNRQK